MEEETCIFSDDMGIRVVLKGELDHHRARSLCPLIDQALYQYKKPRLAMDLSGVCFMDSAGLGLILGRYTKVTELQGEMVLLCPAPGVEKILQLAGVDRLIPILHPQNADAAPQ